MNEPSTRLGRTRVSSVISAPRAVPDLTRVLVPGGLLVVDNVLSHPDDVRELRCLVSGETGVTEVVVPTGAGALLVVKGPE